MKRMLMALVLVLAFVSTAQALQATLTWTDGATGEDGYRVERRDGVDTNPWASQGTVTGVTTFNQAGIALGTRYCYRVVAFNTFGDSATAPLEACGTPDVPLGGATGLTVIFAP